MRATPASRRRSEWPAPDSGASGKALRGRAPRSTPRAANLRARAPRCPGPGVRRIACRSSVVLGTRSVPETPFFATGAYARVRHPALRSDLGRPSAFTRARSVPDSRLATLATRPARARVPERVTTLARAEPLASRLRLRRERLAARLTRQARPPTVDGFDARHRYVLASPERRSSHAPRRTIVGPSIRCSFDRTSTQGSFVVSRE